MGKYILQKIKNKLWLSICLVIGLSLFVAIVSCQPNFQMGSANKLLQRMFYAQLEETGKYPAMLGKSGSILREEIPDVDHAEEMLNQERIHWNELLPQYVSLETQTKYFIMEYGYRQYSQKKDRLYVTYMPEVGDHIQVTYGTSLQEAETDGAYPCIMSEYVMDHNNLILGEVLTFDQVLNNKGEPLKIVVAGFFEELSPQDLFWYYGPNENAGEIFVSREDFEEILDQYQVENYFYDTATTVDFEQMNTKDASGFLRGVKRLMAESNSFRCSFLLLLKRFEEKQKSIGVMLWVLEFPISGMMLAFIYMVSGQIVLSGRNEIATLKSRGFFRKQVVWMYFLEYVLLSVVAYCIGVPLGFGLSKVAASTTDFMTFGGADVELYSFAVEALWYGACAVLVGILCVILPVVFHSKINIVEQKSGYDLGKKQLWEKLFLDVLLLGVTLYLTYTYTKSLEELRQKALMGDTVDPLIFLNIAMFMLACGLFAYRFVHYLVKGIYRLGRKKWKPVAYAAFLQITRSFHKQTFVSVFMILTVAFGLFNANIARTISRNSEERIEYVNGADMSIQEKWTIKTYLENGAHKFRYIEPDYTKYELLKEAGLCSDYTRVATRTGVQMRGSSGVADNCLVMGIDTKEFGETVDLNPGLYTDRHWYEDLNLLARNLEGVIISENLASKLGGLQSGDYIYMSQEQYNQITNVVVLRVSSVVEAWPGFVQYTYHGVKEEEQYLVVMNFQTLLNKLGMYPYDIWMRQEPGVTSDEILAFLEEKGVTVVKSQSTQRDVLERKQAPDIQIVNGMFTLSFLISLFLCGAGFLIYWLISMKQRELLLGGYRAMGMSVKHVNRMLLYEHLFSTLPALLAGGGVGFLSTYLFVNLFGVIFLPEKSPLELYTYFQLDDLAKLFALIVVVIIICLWIIRLQIKRMNITQALKLGED